MEYFGLSGTQVFELRGDNM